MHKYYTSTAHINKHICSIKRAQVVAKWCHWLEYAYCLITHTQTHISPISAGRFYYFTGVLDSLSSLWYSFFVSYGMINSFMCVFVWVRVQFTFISINHFVIKSSFDSAIRQLNFIWFNEISGTASGCSGGGGNGIDVEIFVSDVVDVTAFLCHASRSQFNTNFTCFRVIFRFRMFRWTMVHVACTYMCLMFMLALRLLTSNDTTVCTHSL